MFHSQALQAAADYLRAQWASLGYQVVSQSYEAHGVRSENLEVTLPGVSRPSEIILIGAHYDSVKGSPGANDNASGVAAQRGKRLPAQACPTIGGDNETE